MFLASSGVRRDPFGEMNGTPISLQNDHEDGTSQWTAVSSGTKPRTKVSTRESSGEVGTREVESVKPPYPKRNASTARVVDKAPANREICGANANRSSEDFPSTVTTMLQRDGPLDVLKGRRHPGVGWRAR